MFTTKCPAARAARGLQSRQQHKVNARCTVARSTESQAATAPSIVSRQGDNCTQLTLEEAAVCRDAALERDAGRQQNYTEASTTKAYSTTNGVPVAQLDDEYSRATISLASKIEQYASMDVYDKARIGLVKELKGDGMTWVSKYARGGSARSQSARRMYIAVDAVLGHLASNGLAPYPQAKFKKVQQNLTETREFLQQGK